MPGTSVDERLLAQVVDNVASLSQRVTGFQETVGTTRNPG